MKNFKDDKKSNTSESEIEDTTKYGEFISSYFSWITLDKQKRKAEEMDKMTKEKEP